ncbi:hypothetical protein N9D97_05900 [Planktomarina temperata]|nr:hypothetical protein [Planktomarina temperata]
MREKIEFSILYVVLKIIMTIVMFFVLTFIFEIEPNHYQDFHYYVSNPDGQGPNMGFRYLLNFLRIESPNDYSSMILAFSLNAFIDVVWILLFKKYLSKREIYAFIILLSLHPYLATYTLKFSSIIFSKLAVLLFFHGMINERISKQTFSLNMSLFWIVISIIRNSNVFIFIPMLLYHLRSMPLTAVISALAVSAAIYWSSVGYLDGLNPENWPWSLAYLRDLSLIENNILLVFIFFSCRLLLLFGAREKVFTEGIEPFLVPGLPTLELTIYVTLGVVQIVGYCVAVKFLFRRYAYYSLLPYLPLILSFFSVSHARYILPYLPICFLGLILLTRGRSND